MYLWTVNKKAYIKALNNQPKTATVDLKRIDTLWHFFATQNHLFLKKTVETEVTYKMRKGDVELRHTFNPRFLSESSLSIQNSDFEMAVRHYGSAKRRFGIKEPFQKPNEGIFFPKELLKLNSLYSFYVERDRAGAMKVALVPFLPKKIADIQKPVNLVTKTLWGFNFFSETIKN